MSKKRPKQRVTIRGWIGKNLATIGAFVNAPRYAGAFIFADLHVIPGWLTLSLDILNGMAGIFMGMLEAESTILLYNFLRKNPPTIRYKVKGEKEEKSRPNFRWYFALGLGIVQLMLAPVILVSYMDARGLDKTMYDLMQEVNSASYLSLVSIWNSVVVIAPLIVVGIASFAEGGISHEEVTELSESSAKVSGNFPKDWRKVTHEMKVSLARMDAKKIAEEVGFD